MLTLFALLLPIMILLCTFAINLAYMQLVSTELKIATDAAAHAGGRAMSIHQDTDEVYRYVQQVAQFNEAGGQTVTIAANDDEIQFGQSIRANNGYGRYQFNFIPKTNVDHGIEQATSVAVNTELSVPFVFQALRGRRSVTMSRRSIATQVDRDIALVLDRSGSMLTYRDEGELADELRSIYYRGLISWYEYRRARRGYYTEKIVNALPPSDVKDYVYDRVYSSESPRYCRWYYLDQAVDAFLDVLDGTDQEEQVSLVTFSSTARVESLLSKDFTPVRELVSGIYPYGATAIGSGMETGIPPIVSGTDARPFASKTIVVLTDGRNNVLPDPEEVVRTIVANNNVTIHTVTFTTGADQSGMANVATLGGGRHYHANEGDELVEIFEEIANNLPTILTK